ncbi:pentatricopeptide repeat-containing protein At1g62350-like [Chenopodium quinoa]|uniref:pentatricopeptide repeat-containing protein At1g62350-like n=1 Tax=Chenopodium quinoa TaxID=63459 RepID=UPI000B776615|nr:pentatricopeptide repeat-containing protein At1g62350-like [Chenopodium quinoa]
MFVHSRSAKSFLRAISISISTSTSNPETISHLFPKTLNPNFNNKFAVEFQWLIRKISTSSSAGGVWRNPNSISIWRRKKEIGKEGLIVAKELKRLQSNPNRLQRCIQSHVSRLLKSDLVSVLAEFQRQDQVFLSMKLYDVVRKEIWYRPDMFFYRDMLMMLARNKKVDEAKRVWEDLKREEVLFDQHTFGDIMRAFLDNELPDEAIEIYAEMRQSPDPPLSLPFRVILKGLIPYPELREKIKADFLELFPGYSVYDPPEDLFEDQDWKTECDLD